MALDIAALIAAFMVGVLIGVILLGLCAAQNKKTKESEDVIMGYKDYMQITKEEALIRRAVGKDDEVLVLVPGPDWEDYTPMSLDTLLNGVLYFVEESMEEELHVDDGRLSEDPEKELFGETSEEEARRDDGNEAGEDTADEACETCEDDTDETCEDITRGDNEDDADGNCDRAAASEGTEESETLSEEKTAGTAGPFIAAGESGAEKKTAADEKKEEGKKKSKLDDGKILALYRAGWPKVKIADEMGCSDQTICNHLKKMLKA